METTEREDIKEIKILEFVIFCIENVAQRLGVNAEVVYDALHNADIINDYIVPEYDILHTQGKEYIVDDLLDVMAKKGVKI